jgi:hypothetical protein
MICELRRDESKTEMPQGMMNGRDDVAGSDWEKANFSFSMPAHFPNSPYCTVQYEVGVQPSFEFPISPSTPRQPLTGDGVSLIFGVP